MNKKILASLIIISILSFALGWGTYSYFSDVEESKDNVFKSGTIDLKLSNDGENFYDGVSYSIMSPENWAPGENFTDYIWLKNVGTIDAVVVLIDFKKGYVWDEEFASNITVEIGGTDWFGNKWYPLELWTEHGTLNEIIEIDWGDFPEPNKWDLIIFENYEDKEPEGLGAEDYYYGAVLPAGEVRALGFRFTFNATAGNDLQGRQTMLDIEFAILQAPGNKVQRGNLPTAAVDAGW